MTRPARENIKSNFIHIVTKGIKDEFIFYKKDYKNKYIELITKYSKKIENIRIIAYCVMDNHVHILMHTNNIHDVESFMRKVNTSYAIFYNVSEDRNGYVFANRYHTQIIQNEEHLFLCIDYIHKNPVKAGIVSEPYNYAYSSCKQMQDKKANLQLKELICKKDLTNFEFKNNSTEPYSFTDVIEKTKKLERKDIEIIIEEFCLKYNTSIQEVRKSNSLIIKLKHYFNTKYKISNKNICAILGIGKNRISWIEKRMHIN